MNEMRIRIDFILNQFALKLRKVAEWIIVQEVNVFAVLKWLLSGGCRIFGVYKGCSLSLPVKLCGISKEIYYFNLNIKLTWKFPDFFERPKYMVNT